MPAGKAAPSECCQGVEHDLVNVNKDNPRDFRYPQSDQCRPDGGDRRHPTVQGGIGDFENIAGEGLIAADELLHCAEIGFFFDQLLLNP